jgi:hypothetical protein
MVSRSRGGEMYPEEMSGLITRDLRAAPPDTAAAKEARHAVGLTGAGSDGFWKLMRELLAGPPESGDAARVAERTDSTGGEVDD